MNFRSLFGPSQDAHIDGELLSAYLDGQVKPDELRRVETHLGTCPACQSELASLRQTVTMLHALPRVPVPRAFTLSEAQVGLRRPAPAGAPTWFGGMARGLAAVSAVALVAVMAAVLLRQPSWQPSQNIARIGCSCAGRRGAGRSAPPIGGRRRGHSARRTDGYRQSPESCRPLQARRLQPRRRKLRLRQKRLRQQPHRSPLERRSRSSPKNPPRKPVTAIVEAQSSAAKAQADQPGPPSAAAAVPVTPLPTDRPTAAPVALAAAARHRWRRRPRLWL